MAVKCIDVSCDRLCFTSDIVYSYVYLLHTFSHSFLYQLIYASFLFIVIVGTGVCAVLRGGGCRSSNVNVYP